MGRFDFSAAGPLASCNIASAPEPEITAETELRRGQIIALLLLRVPSAGEDSLYAKVLTYLRAVGSDEPDAIDYSRLRDDRYIYFDGMVRRDKLLPPGLHAIERIARDIAKRCGIHHVTFREALPQSNMGPSAACSCGHWHQIGSRKRGDDDRVRRSAAFHLEQVAKGTFKPRRSIEEFLNEHMPLRLPLAVHSSKREV